MLNIYKASAGSGKTFQLARKYIQLLIGWQNNETGKWHLNTVQNNSHRHSLAITFTNKATAEMKKRIVTELSVLSHPNTVNDSAYIKYFIDLFKVPSESISKQSRIALMNLLSNFRNFNVSTIDSFFQNILRTFAHELDLDDNYDLRLDDREVIESAVEDLLNTINNNSTLNPQPIGKKEIDDISDWLISYMDSLLIEGKSFNFFNDNGKVRSSLVDFIVKLLDERFRSHSNKIISWCNNRENLIGFRKYCKEKYENLRNSARASAVNILNRIDETSAATGQPLIKTNVGFFKVADALAKKSSSCPKIEFSNTLLKGINVDIKVLFYKNYIDIYPDDPIYDDVRRYCQDTHEKYPYLKFYSLLLSNIYPLGLFGEVLKRIEGYRKKFGAFLLSDTNEFLHRIIGDEDSPFIYERTGTTLKHFLLDEFQDTSQLQWYNLKPLLIQSLSTNEDNLIIGDEKQCIYRFRNSDPRLINSQVKQELLRHTDKIEESGNRPEENTNWRSAPNIVKFNNTLFLDISQAMGLQDFYKNTVQASSIKRERQDGYVNMEFPDGVHDFRFKYFEDNQDDYNDKERIALDRMAAHIERQLQSGFKPNQIAILVRTSMEGDRVIRSLLTVTNDMDVKIKPEIVSVDSILLKESKAVKYIISRLRLLITPEVESNNFITAQGTGKRFNRKRKLRGLVNRFNLINFEYGINNTENMGEALTEALKDMFLEENTLLPELQSKSMSSSVGLFELCQNILSDFKTQDEKSHDPYMQYEDLFIATFMDKVLEQESIIGCNIPLFLKWWDNKGSESSVHFPANPNAILVITIHKSKGLEYDCVHIPFVNFDLHSSLKHQSYHWFAMREATTDENTNPFPPFMPLVINKNMADMDAFRKEYQELLEDNELDVLNVLYVAFTRAIAELIITVTGPTEIKDTPSNISQLIFKAVTNNNALMSLSANDNANTASNHIIQFSYFINDNTIIIGSPISHKETITTKEKRNEADKNKANKITIPEIELMPPLNLNSTKDITAYTHPLSYNKLDWDNPLQRGNFLHTVLQNISTFSDLDYAVNKTGYDWDANPEILTAAKAILYHAFEKLPYKRWFEDYDYLLNEIPVYQFRDSGNREETELKRPDRVIFYNDGSVDVVDYKFGEERKIYRNQIKKYVELLRKAGYQNVRGFLWFPVMDIIVEV